MEPKLTFNYDREADILTIDVRPPYAEQESQEMGDGVGARLNPQTGDVENLEVMFFSTRLPSRSPEDAALIALYQELADKDVALAEAGMSDKGMLDEADCA